MITAPTVGVKPTAAYRYLLPRDSWVVLVWERNIAPAAAGTPWDGIIRVSVKHTRASNTSEYLQRGFGLPVSWDDLQAIKDRFWPERIGLEVYPPRDCIVDVADLRWLWVLPVTASLPFNLQTGVDVLKGGNRGG